MTVAPVKVDRYDFTFGQAAATRPAKSPRVTCVVTAVPAAELPAAVVGLALAGVACGWEGGGS
jgi:hypothetical protein